MAINIGGMRTPYLTEKESFTEDQLVSKEPIGQFDAWFKEACKIPEIIEANAMCLATATKDGVPSARMVLLKSYGKDGFRFFTNYSSRKGRELNENPQASLCFYWEPLKRSVRVEGRVEKVSDEESKAYFNSRPKASQIGACVSAQSKVIKNRQVLTDEEHRLKELYGEGNLIPKPVDWGGFVVIPDRIEFWQGQSNRIHDRIIYRRKTSEEEFLEMTTEGEDGWLIERLAP